MTDIHQKKMVSHDNGAVNPIVAGIAGMVVGGIAAATAIVMSDKSKQKKIKNMLGDLKGKVVEGFDENKKKLAKKIIDS